MDNNIDFKELWAKQPISPPNTNDLFLKVRNLKKANLRIIIITNILCIVTSAFIIFIWVYYQPQFLTTKLGIVLTILAMVISLIAFNQSIPLLKNTNNSQSNSEYLKNLLSIKTKQQFLQTTMLRIYLVMLSLGIGLYMYEYTLRMTRFWAIFTYLITLAWILFNWFYIRPKQIKKHQTKLDDIISKFKTLSKQLDE